MSNRIIEEKNKSIDDYKDIISRIEQKLDIANFLIAENSLKISKLEKSNSALSEKVSQNERKIIELEESNSFLKK